MSPLLLAAIAATTVAAPPSATSAGFTAVQATTIDPQRFVREWSVPGANANLHTEHVVQRGQAISAFITFKGCKADAAGACHVSAVLEIVDPAGHAAPLPARFEVWNRPPLPPPQFALAGSAPAIAFDATDAPGRYTFLTTVTDRVAGTTVEVGTAVELRAPGR